MSSVCDSSIRFFVAIQVVLGRYVGRGMDHRCALSFFFLLKNRYFCGAESCSIEKFRRWHTPSVAGVR